MATIDLGKIKFVFRDTYDNSASYVPDDVVTFTDGSVTSSTYVKLQHQVIIHHLVEQYTQIGNS